MSLADEMAEEFERSHSKCTFCSWLKTQDEQAQLDVKQWFDGGGEASVVWRVCLRRGLTLSETTVRKHKRECVKAAAEQ
jgi:hypothetical protein